MKKIILLLICFQFGSCQSNAQKKQTKTNFEISKTEAEWRKVLTAKEFNVLRKSGTEPAFSSPLNKVEQAGTFVCAACKTHFIKPSINLIAAQVGQVLIVQLTAV